MGWKLSAFWVGACFLFAAGTQAPSSFQVQICAARQRQTRSRERDAPRIRSRYVNCLLLGSDSRQLLGGGAKQQGHPASGPHRTAPVEDHTGEAEVPLCNGITASGRGRRSPTAGPPAPAAHGPLSDTWTEEPARDWPYFRQMPTSWLMRILCDHADIGISSHFGTILRGSSAFDSRGGLNTFQFRKTRGFPSG